MACRVPGRGDDADAVDDVVVAGDRLVTRAGEVDPFEDRVVGRVGELPFDRLDMDRDVREGGVLAGVVGMEVAVGDGGDLVETDAGLRQDVGDAPGGGLIPGVELGVAEAEAGVEEEDARRVPHGVPDHHPAPVRQLRIREPELPELERDDLRNPSCGHAAGREPLVDPAAPARRRSRPRRRDRIDMGRQPGAPDGRGEGGVRGPERAHPKMHERGPEAPTRGIVGARAPGVVWRRGRDSNPRWVAPNRISSAAP